MVGNVTHLRVKILVIAIFLILLLLTPWTVFLSANCLAVSKRGEKKVFFLFITLCCISTNKETKLGFQGSERN